MPGLLELKGISVAVQEGVAGGRPDSLFGVGWVNVLLTGLFWFVVIITSFMLIRFIVPPKGRTVVGEDGSAKQDKD